MDNSADLFVSILDENINLTVDALKKMDTSKSLCELGTLYYKMIVNYRIFDVNSEDDRKYNYEYALYYYYKSFIKDNNNTLTLLNIFNMYMNGTHPDGEDINMARNLQLKATCSNNTQDYKEWLDNMKQKANSYILNFEKELEDREFEEKYFDEN